MEPSCVDHSCIPADAAPDAPEPRVKLMFQVATTTTSGGPDPALEYVPIPDASIRIGPLNGPLAPAAYDATDGSVPYSHELDGTTWRLEYTVGSEVTEVQWAPQPSQGFITVPLFGRVERQSVPPGSGYQFTPTGSGAPGSGVLTIFTTGVWTENTLPSLSAPYPIAMDSQQSLSGAKGTPEANKGDRVIATQNGFNATTFCTAVNGATSFAPPSLIDGFLVTVTPNPAWITAPTRTVTFSYDISSGTALTTRFATALGSRDGGTGLSVRAGYIPHEQMPMLARPTFPKFGGVPSLTFLQVASCPYGRQASEPFVDGTPLSMFPLVSYGLISNPRRVNQTPLASEIETIGAAPGFPIDTSVPLAIAPTLSDGTQTVADLAGAADGVSAAAGSGSLELVFEIDSNGPFDYFEAILVRIGGAFPTIERTYLVADPSQRRVAIDPASFQRGVEYAFAIRLHRGQPQVAQGDFRLVTYPQSATTIFTRTFRVQ